MIITTASGLSMPSILRDELLLEVGGFCPIPRCKLEAWDFFPVDGNTKHISRDNLVPLCRMHFSMANAKKLSSEMLRAIRNLLSLPSSPKIEYRLLETRAELLTELVKQVNQSADDMRLNYVGPLIVHPEWYHSRRDELNKKIPNMERPIREALRQLSPNNYRIRLIFRNVPRYVQKLDEVINPDERTKFIQETLEDINQVWGEDGSQGPEIVCVETGFFRHPFIFKDTVIEATRTAPHLPTQGGILHTDPEYVKWEKENFDRIFDGSSRGQKNELNSLREYVANLWK